MNFLHLLMVRGKFSARFFAFALPIILMASAPAWADSCNTPASDVVSTVRLPGSPFSAIPTRNGCTIFVSMNLRQDRAGQGHIAVLGREDGKVALVRDIRVPGHGGVRGMKLTHDGKLLAAANGSGVLLFNVDRLLAGEGKPVAEAKDGAEGKRSAGSIQVAISPDDKLLFVSDEAADSVTVYNLPNLRNGNVNPIGHIAVGEAPVGLVFSPDGHKLYSTSEEAQPGDTPVTCLALDGSGSAERQGLLTVVDVARAASDPAGSVLAKVAGGCDFVRVTLSKDGTRAFVTARSADSLLVFDTAKLAANPDHALLATTVAGNAPVGVAAAGRYIVTADSNRLAPAGRKSEWLSVIDPVSFKVIGNVPAGLFPRELYVTADGKTLLVTNSNSNNLELVNLERLTPAYFAHEKTLKDADDAELARFRAAIDERVKHHWASPGTEAALRHVIGTIANGRLDYDALDSEVANATDLGNARHTAQLHEFGALQSITFKSTNRNGVDTFEVTFEHAKTDWNISLAPDGKVAWLNFQPVK